MRASRDYRKRYQEITITMNAEEFRETVEWLEELSPYDGCTEHWREELDRVCPLPSDDETL